MVQNGAPLTPPHLAMSERIRFTIAVESEVYDAFADLAESSGQSLSRCIGDWLRDTAEAAQITTIKVNEVRAAPQAITRAFVDMMAREALSPAVQAALGGMRGGAPRVGAVGTRSGGTAAVSPPSSNTGGKVPGKTRSTKL